MTTITVHQTRRETGACWREFVFYPATADAVAAKLGRIERAYDMSVTRVTDENGTLLAGTEHGADTEFSHL